jgi:cytochrome c553
MLVMRKGQGQAEMPESSGNPPSGPLTYRPPINRSKTPGGAPTNPPDFSQDPVMRMHLSALLLASAMLATFSTKAQAAGDVQRGKLLADTCMGCHGIAGYRNTYPSFRVPKLGGQNADYIVIALTGYRAETRAHKTMHAQAATMSDQDMQDIATYFSSQGAPKAGPAKVTAGKDKAATCAACHGEAGISSAPNWPNLAGQYRDYLVHAITEYKTGARKDPIMGSQAQALSAADIEAVAAYFAGQSGLFTVHYTGK